MPPQSQKKQAAKLGWSGRVQSEVHLALVIEKLRYGAQVQVPTQVAIKKAFLGDMALWEC